MTVQTNTNSIAYVGNGSTVHFDYDFLVIDDDHLKVYFGDVLQTSGYVVSGVGSQTGGIVAFAVAPSSGTSITLTRDVPFTQLTDYQPYDAFPAESHERALDLLTMMAQQLKDSADRSMQYPVGGNRWDAKGNEIINVGTGNSGTSAANVNQVTQLIAELAGPDSAAFLQTALAAVDGASMSLSQVATAYSIPFGMLSVWGVGSASNTSKFWWYGNRVWQSNNSGHTLESSPSFLTAHIVPVDGVLYPDHFGATYIPGTDQTPAIQRCEDWQKARNAPLRLRSVEHTLLTKLVILRAPCIIAEAGGYGVTTASPASSNRRPQGAVLIGKVAGDFSVVVSPAQFEFGGQIENVTITGKESTSATKTAGKAIRLHNFGWSGRVKGLSVLDFNGKGLEIGYLQDTVFDQLTILGCGPTSAQRSLSFTSNSNYLYFNNPHIEDGNYLLGCSEAVDKPWEIHWNGAHFESGDYNGALGPVFDHSYTTEPVEFDGCYRWYFNHLTAVPASVQRLMAVNGGDSASQPYFMRGSNTSKINGSNVRFICPRNGGGIDAIKLSGDFSGNDWSSLHVEGAQGAKYCVTMESGAVRSGSMTFPVSAETKMFGFSINSGVIDKIRFANGTGGSAKTSGYLISSAVDAKLTSGEHSYELGTAPFAYIGQYVHSVDSRVNGYRNLISGETLDLEKMRPDFGIYNGTTGAIIANIINCPRSRLLRIRNDSGSMAINFTGSVKPNGASNWSVGAYSSVSLKADHTGIMYQV